MSFSSKKSMFNMTSSMRTSYTFNLTSPYNASLILSDPNFFITNGNPVAIPKVKIEINGDFGFRPFYISATKVKNMNTKATPCEESKQYKYKECVKTWVSKVCCPTRPPTI